MCDSNYSHVDVDFNEAQQTQYPRNDQRHHDHETVQIVLIENCPCPDISSVRLDSPNQSTYTFQRVLFPSTAPASLPYQSSQIKCTMTSNEGFKIYHTSSGDWTILSPNDQWIMELPSAEPSSSCTASQLVETASDSDELQLMRLLKQGLDKKPSEVTPHTIDKGGAIKIFDENKSMLAFLTSRQNYTRSTQPLTTMKEGLTTLLSTERNLPDESNPDRCARAFLRHIFELCMVEGHENKCGWTHPLKLHMDVVIIQKFLDHMNETYHGLTQNQCNRIQTVIHAYNKIALKHRGHDGRHHMQLTIARNFSL